MASNPTNQNIFTRLQPSDPNVVPDIYDKLNAVQQSLAQNAQAIATTQLQLAPLIAAGSSAGGGGGTPGGPSLTFVPAVDPLPSASPGVSPYAQDGVIVDLTPSAAQPGSLYRYDIKSFSWVGPLLGGILIDTHANRTNYAPSDYSGLLYFETDTRWLYRSDGTNWKWLGGMYENLAASRPTLTANDSGALYVAIDWNVAWHWTGAAWTYYWGTYSDIFTNRPSSLTTNDLGFLFVATDAQEIFYWTGSAWVLVASVFTRTTLVLTTVVVSGSTYTVTAADFSLQGTFNGTQTFTLPDVGTVPGQIFAVKKAYNATGKIVLGTVSAQVIDGQLSQTLYPGDSITIQASGSAWIVLDLYRYSAGEVLQNYASAQLVLTTSFQDIVNAAVTLDRAGKWLIQGVAECDLAATDGATTVELVAGGVIQSGVMHVFTPTNVAIMMATQVWYYTAAVGDVAKLRAKMNIAGGGGSFIDTNTSITATWMSV